LGSLVSALEAYQKAAELDPQNTEAWIKWSVLNHEQGNYDDAANLMLSAIDELPEESIVLSCFDLFD
jgi:tetratricopeptide (TPR) repeat protein